MIRKTPFALLLTLLLAPVSAHAQTSPNWSYGYVPTAAQWNALFASKQDYLGTPSCPTSGCTFNGKVITNPPTTASAGFSLPPGTAPTSPVNGDVWTTTAGLFAQINGSTIGPFVSTATGSFLPLAGGTMTGTITGVDGGTWDSGGIGGTTIKSSSLLATGLPFSGYLLGTNIAAPSTPASGHTAIYVDSTQKILGVKNDTGAISLSVFPSSASTHQFGTGLTSNGQLTFAQPTYADISGLGTMAQQNAGAVAITGGTITGLPTPGSASDAATKQYVDSSAVGLVVHPSVVLATTAALPANTYNNGSSGVGATLTANANGNLVIDGTTNPVATTRILVKNETTAANNGIYTVTTTGGASQSYVLTRATDANTPGTGNPAEIGFGSYALVTSGTTNANSGWSVNSVVTTIGTSAITWVQFSSSTTGVTSLGGLSGVVSLGTGLPVSGSTINTPWTLSGGNLSNNNAGLVSINQALQLTGNPNIEVMTASTGQFGYLEFYDQSTTKWQLGKDTANSFYVLDRVSGNSLLVAPSNGNLIELLPSGGKVGIGNSSPAYALDVTAVSGAATGLRITGQFGASSDNASIRFAGQKDGNLWAIGPDVGAGGATEDFEFYNLVTGKTAINLSAASNVNVPQNLYVGGGAPWVDVKSGANSCAAAAGNGSTNDQSAIQCQINWMIANHAYGAVFFPCGTYIINGGLDATNGHAAGSPRLVGESVGCVILQDTANETALTLGNWGAAQAKPGMDQIFVYCSNAGPTEPCVVQSGGPVDIKNSTIQGGEWALVNHGSDGTVFNSYIAGVGGIQGTAGNCNASTMPSTTTPLTLCYGNLYTDGANWYIDDKFDQNAVQDISIYITSVGGSGVEENSFIRSDSSDNVRNGLVVFDNGAQHAITAWSGYGPISTPIYIRSADYTLITNSNMSGGVSNSSISVTGTICGATITGAGTKTTAGNIGTC